MTLSGQRPKLIPAAKTARALLPSLPQRGMRRLGPSLSSRGLDAVPEEGAGTTRPIQARLLPGFFVFSGTGRQAASGSYAIISIFPPASRISTRAWYSGSSNQADTASALGNLTMTSMS